MLFTRTLLAGAYVIDLERLEDERGFFARSYCEKEFDQKGLCARWVQCNVSYNARRGTLRGMHYQAPPFEEAKLVRCTRGGIYDVIIDLRPESSTYKQHFGVELNEDNRSMLYIPGGFAHGFLTLTDQTEVFYQMSEFYHPSAAGAVRWNDETFGIVWPEPVAVISEKDAQWPDFQG